MKKTIQKTFFALGTVNSIMIPGCENEAGLCFAMQRVRALDEKLSVFKESSEISQINAAAGRHFVQVAPDTLQVVKSALEFSTISEGAFDISLRPLVELWGSGAKNNNLPGKQQIADTLELVDYRDVIVNDGKSSVMLKRPGQALDLGGIAKGYAADEVRRILMENGVTNALINLGGTVAAIGPPRLIGIQHPKKVTGSPMGKLQIKDQAVVTSGFYEKCFFKDGVRYHHILDPRSGYPANSGLESVTLIGESAMELDALATAICILGMDKGFSIAALFAVEAVFVTENQDVFTTPGLKDKFALI